MLESNLKISNFILCRPERVSGLPGSYLGVLEVKPHLTPLLPFSATCWPFGNCALLGGRTNLSESVVYVGVPTAFKSEHLLVWGWRWNGCKYDPSREVW